MVAIRNEKVAIGDDTCIDTLATVLITCNTLTCRRSRDHMYTPTFSGINIYDGWQIICRCQRFVLVHVYACPHFRIHRIHLSHFWPVTATS